MFFQPEGRVFATMMALFWNKTVLDFWIVQEFTLRHKTGRTGRWLCLRPSRLGQPSELVGSRCSRRWAAGQSHYEWCFEGFCISTKLKKNCKSMKNNDARTYTYSLFPCPNNNVHTDPVQEQSCIISLYTSSSTSYSSTVVDAAGNQGIQQLYTLPGHHC